MRKYWIIAVLALVWCAAALAGDIKFLSGGCGSDNQALYGNPSLTVDAAGRSCTGFYYSYSNITTVSTTTNVKTSAGVLHSLVFNNPGSGAVVTLFDNASTATGTKIGTITMTSTSVPVTLTYDIAFANGLTIQTQTATSDITVSFK